MMMVTTEHSAQLSLPYLGFTLGKAELATSGLFSFRFGIKVIFVCSRAGWPGLA